jgi:GTPase SAR1 family protein
MPPTKVIFVGKSRIGKTHTVERLLNYLPDSNPHYYTPTKGVNTYTYKNKNGKEFHIWDIGSDSRYEGLGEAYYIGAELCVTFGNRKLTERKVKKIVTEVKFHHYRSLTKLQDLLDCF